MRVLFNSGSFMAISLLAILWNAIVVLSFASPAFAQGTGNTDTSGQTGFRSPSGNIHCQYFDGGLDKPPSANVVRCDIKSIGNPPPARPKDCELEWGQAFEINDRAGSAQRLCYGDTVMDPRLPVLPYGAAWQRGGIACKSGQSGVSCVNAKGNGFELSRNAQRLF
jgi:hypothetical protein